MLKKVELAYIAGLFDGEGCVVIRVCNKVHSIYVQITNTNRDILDWLQDSFGGSVRLNGNIKPCFNCAVVSDDAHSFLTRILPFIIIKSRQVELAVDFHYYKRYIHPMSEEEREWRESYKNAISDLNQRVKNPRLPIADEWRPVL